MSIQTVTVETVEQCTDCGTEFKPVRVSDPRKGYDVLQEDATGWTVQCKGCGTQLVIEK